MTGDDPFWLALRKYQYCLGKKEFGRGSSVASLIILGRLAQGAACMTDLAEVAGISTAAITGLVDTLEHLGLAQRSHEAGDRRMVRVSLTEKGAGVIREMPSTIEATHRVVLPERK